MSRLLGPLLSALLVAVAGASIAAQPPAGRKVPSAQDAPSAATGYFPNKKGTKWVYKVGEDTIEVVADSGGKLNTIVRGKTVASETIEVRADGIYRTKVNEVAIEPPVKIMSLPADKDATWKVEGKLQRQDIKGQFTQKAAKEKVKVPAGEFECVLVDGPDHEVAGVKAAVKYWFADGKYIVKLVYNIAGNQATLELQEFAEAK